jgi:hypothetical protein
MKLALVSLVSIALGFGAGWLIFESGVFAGSDPASRHDVEQAVIDSGFGTPNSVRCARVGTDHAWDCVATFPDHSTHRYRATALSPDDPERLRAQLRQHGERRRAARQADRDELEAIAELLPEAMRAGISKREIERLTGVSRPWIDELLRRDDT